MAYGWFYRKIGASPNNTSSYKFIGAIAPSCPTGCKICALYAEIDEIGRIIIDSSLQSQMITAMSTCSNQSRVLLRTT